MKQTIHNENTGIDYTLVGEVYLPNLVLPHGDYEIGVWGERYRTYLKTHRKAFYTSLKMQCQLDKHLREVDTRASEMYDNIVKHLAQREGITEALKAADMMQWVAAMNNISNRAREIVWNDITSGGE
ncbi:MAG: TnpV protein [Ruminococcaceae bacterium]|nr:TnpV protein [Oscillospiraceae bacterium]